MPASIAHMLISRKSREEIIGEYQGHFPYSDMQDLKRSPA
jgi:hypothetical protein